MAPLSPKFALALLVALAACALSIRDRDFRVGGFKELGSAQTDALDGDEAVSDGAVVPGKRGSSVAGDRGLRPLRDVGGLASLSSALSSNLKQLPDGGGHAPSLPAFSSHSAPVRGARGLASSKSSPALSRSRVDEGQGGGSSGADDADPPPQEGRRKKLDGRLGKALEYGKRPTRVQVHIKVSGEASPPSVGKKELATLAYITYATITALIVEALSADHAEPAAAAFFDMSVGMPTCKIIVTTPGEGDDTGKARVDFFYDIVVPSGSEEPISAAANTISDGLFDYNSMLAGKLSSWLKGEYHVSSVRAGEKPPQRFMLEADCFKVLLHDAPLNLALSGWKKYREFRHFFLKKVHRIFGRLQTGETESREKVPENFDKWGHEEWLKDVANKPERDILKRLGFMNC